MVAKKQQNPVLTGFLWLLLISPIHVVTAAPGGDGMPVAELESALASTDLTGLFGLIDTRALAARAGLDSGVADALERLRHRLGKQQFNDHRLYTTADGWLVLRLDLAPRGLTWLEPTWQHPSPDPARPLVDWYDSALGIHLSELVAGMVELAESRTGRRFLETLDESPRRAWSGLSRREQRENPAAARLLLASCGGNPCYELALEAMQQLPQLQPALWQLDLAALRNDRAGFADTLTRLETLYGPDPGFAWLGGAEALRHGDCSTAMPRINNAVGDWPDYKPLYPVLTQCLVVAGNYSMALSFFGIMEERFGLQFDWPAMAQHPVYKGLVESDTFAEWQAERGAR